MAIRGISSDICSSDELDSTDVFRGMAIRGISSDICSSDELDSTDVFRGMAICGINGINMYHFPQMQRFLGLSRVMSV